MITRTAFETDDVDVDGEVDVHNDGEVDVDNDVEVDIDNDVEAKSSQPEGIGETAGANTMRSASEGSRPMRSVIRRRAMSDSSEAEKGGSSTFSSRSVDRCESGSKSRSEAIVSP